MIVFDMSFSAIVLILAVVFIRVFFCNKLPKKIFLVLWGIVLLKLFIPFYISSPFSIHTVINQMQSVAVKKDNTIQNISKGAIANFQGVFQKVTKVTEKSNLKGEFYLIMLWLLGMEILIAFFLINHLKYLKEYKTALPLQNNFIERWLSENKIRRGIRIHQSDKITAPLTYGIFRPIILLPKIIDLKNEKQLRFILTHEYVHIKRLDIISKWLLAFVLCLHWFNPFVWIMYILANRDIELSCDEKVVLNFGEEVKKDYALTLLQLEEAKSKGFQLCSGFSHNAAEERIRSIMKIKKNSLIGTILSFILIVCVTATFATSAVNRHKPLVLGYNGVLKFIPARGVGGTRGYLYTRGLDCFIHPNTIDNFNRLKKQPRIKFIPLYLKDGKTVVGKFGVSNTAYGMLPSYHKRSPKGGQTLYSINENGYTYGNNFLISKWMGAGNIETPDLVAAMGIDGTNGYVYNDDLEGFKPKNPKEAIEWQNSHHGSRTIPLYEKDGETVIGKFIVGGN